MPVGMCLAPTIRAGRVHHWKCTKCGHLQYTHNDFTISMSRWASLPGLQITLRTPDAAACNLREWHRAAAHVRKECCCWRICIIGIASLCSRAWQPAAQVNVNSFCSNAVPEKQSSQNNVWRSMKNWKPYIKLLCTAPRRLMLLR